MNFRRSLIFSFIFQLVAGVVSSYALFLPIDEKYDYLHSLVGLDSIVQTVEASFYFAFIYYGITASQASKIRYLDWIITTPVMVFTTVAFFFYNSSKRRNQNEKETQNRKRNDTPREDIKYDKLLKPLVDFINYKEHKTSLAIILISNFLMLITGFIGEIRWISSITATLIGFVFFFIEFFYIYKDFVVPYGDYNTKIYYAIFTSVWSLYGIAYLFNETTKNLMYNGLDLVSKNIYSLLLGYFIYTLNRD